MKMTLDANSDAALHNAIELLVEARHQLTALYLELPPDDPGYEVTVAETIVPAPLRGLEESIRVAWEHLTNMRDLYLR